MKHHNRFNVTSDLSPLPQHLCLDYKSVTYRDLTVLALAVKIRKSWDFLAPISGSPGDQIFSLTFRNSISIFLNSHLWIKTAILKLKNT